MLSKKHFKELLIILAIALPLGLFVFFFTGTSLSELKNTSSLHEDTTLLLTENQEEDTTLSPKKTIAAGWDPEVLIAQQIERAIGYQGRDFLLAQKELTNIENNLSYSRNPTAVLFYLAYGYEKINDQEKALAYYKQVRDLYKNGTCVLYIFDVTRTTADDRLYAVSIYEESLLREFLLLKNTAAITSLKYSLANFGVYKKEQFKYSDLAKENELLLKQKLPQKSSAAQYLRLVAAKKTIQNVISESFKIEQRRLAPWLAEDLQQNSSAIAQEIRNSLTSDNQKITFDFTKLQKIGVLYYYTYVSGDQALSVTVVDDGTSLLVGKVESSTKAERMLVNES